MADGNFGHPSEVRGGADKPHQLYQARPMRTAHLAEDAWRPVRIGKRSNLPGPELWKRHRCGCVRRIRLRASAGRIGQHLTHVEAFDGEAANDCAAIKQRFTYWLMDGGGLRCWPVFNPGVARRPSWNAAGPPSGEERPASGARNRFRVRCAPTARVRCARSTTNRRCGRYTCAPAPPSRRS